ncbi:uncharacterized protein LOC110891085 isoform X3 [Helianthus annuus]|uniref:uncharacterized protein LOC110891085 isoform X3 n=1 Tax=Helianthus annuus TaxID=4232 RepID=UPI0016533BA4|nr:uncharacterized protein LOC110891085 isoform X3 [Helianthus annuus]
MDNEKMNALRKLIPDLYKQHAYVKLCKNSGGRRWHLAMTLNSSLESKLQSAAPLGERILLVKSIRMLNRLKGTLHNGHQLQLTRPNCSL